MNFAVPRLLDGECFSVILFRIGIVAQVVLNFPEVYQAIRNAGMGCPIGLPVDREGAPIQRIGNIAVAQVVLDLG